MAGSIEARLQEDMKAALKAGEDGRATLAVIRLARAALQNATIEKRRPLSEEEAIEVMAREVKQRRESAEEYTRLGRPDVAERLEQEIKIVERYLPQPLSVDELRAIIAEAVAEAGAASQRDLGKVMGKVVPRTRGRADGRKVSEMVREALPPG